MEVMREAEGGELMRGEEGEGRRVKGKWVANRVRERKG